MVNKQTTGWIVGLVIAVLALGSVLSYTQAKDRAPNPPGSWGGPGTNWEHPPGPQGGQGAAPERRGAVDRDNHPPGSWGGPGTNWEHPPGPQGGQGAAPERRGAMRSMLLAYLLLAQYGFQGVEHTTSR